MSLSRVLILVAALGTGPSLAQAQSLLDAANAAAANGPVVLQLDPDTGRFKGRPRLAVNRDPAIAYAVPIPHVMNGGGFGYSGFGYYSDATTEGRLGERRRVNEIILAPALRAPLPEPFSFFLPR